ncbi:outer membrane beta-barrel protein [Sphingobium sp. AP49]|uniref:outer membrane beta-barrel protein n=1 Tax=Sphingobium sp. AP49 TaxID=1144307 RepID=UPI00026EC8EF|nr:outer membrane beta-barrel protein [Sphingobium sp. AP49]WHO40657.1 outer membrane beta-barrel protein [Sphingobium sp. AP49]
MNCRRSTITALLVLVAGGWAAPGYAQSLDDKYWLEVGGYMPSVTSKVRVAPASNPDGGTSIDMESDLNLDKHKVLPQVSAGIRLGHNWSLMAEYYSLSRSGEKQISRDISFDDVVYPAGVRMDTSFDSTIYRATFGYSFINKPNTRLGAALGLHATKFDLQLDGEARVGEAGISAQQRKRDVLAPLPTLGLFGAQRIAPDVTLSARADYLSLKIDDYKGRLLNGEAAVTWRFAKNVGIGAMWRYVNYRVDVDKERWAGRLQYRFSGPAVFLQAGF